MIRKTVLGAFTAILLSALIIPGFGSVAAAEQKRITIKDQATNPAAQSTAAVLPQPDLIISNIGFTVVQNTTWGSPPKPCQIYNLHATVTNKGNADAGPFNVLIERNNGANGAFGLACQACLIPVISLAKGSSMKLDDRQFNNCSNNNWNNFRVTADPKTGSALAGKVKESNEGNNSMTMGFNSKQSTPQEKKQEPAAGK